MMYDCNYEWHYFGMHGLWWLFWVILLAVILFTVFGSKINRKRGKDSPLEILKRRYASGDISTEEFEERKKVLEDV
ncbi:MAG: SHOCT domain-containing protein [Cytophagales bacterium]